MSAARVFFPLALLATGACQAGPAAADGAPTADDAGQTTEDGGPTPESGGATTEGGEAPMTAGGASTTDDGASTTESAGSTESGGGPLGCDPAGEIPLPDTGNLYFVDAANGSDNNSGEEAEPLRTIQEGIDRAVAGDTIVLRGGTYAEGDVRFTDSGEPGKPITLRNYPGETPVIDNEYSGNTIVLSASDWSGGGTIGWITLDGLEVKNGNKNIEITNAHDIVITRCYVHGATGQGIHGNGTRVLIDGNVMADNGDFVGAQEHGLYATGTFFTVTNNLFYRNAFWGITVAGYTDKPYYAGPEYKGASDWLIVNNTFAFQHNRSGIVVYHGAVDILIQNNIFYNNATDYAHLCSGVTFFNAGEEGNQLINNLHFGSRPFIATEAGGMYYTETGTINDQDPLFVDPDGLDFHLQENSPAKDQGLATDAPATDYDGRPRPQGAGPDMGAFETCE